MIIMIAAIARDEGKYIREWIIHHLSIGIDRITVYDNQSTDNTREIVNSFGHSHLVECIPWETVEGKSPQLTAYNDVLSNNRLAADLIGFFDIDEFIVPTNGISVKETLRTCISSENNVGAVCVNQRIFGASGRKEYTPEPVMTRFRECSTPDHPENKWVKSFFAPTKIDSIVGVHSSSLREGVHVHPSGVPVVFEDNNFSQANCIDFSALQLNHYITKSFEEFTWKQKRGGGAASNAKARLSRYQSVGFFEGRQGQSYREIDHATEIFAESIEDVIKRFDKDL